MKLSNELCDEYWQRQTIEVKRTVCAVLMELHKAQVKHPQWPKDYIHAAAIVQEESGELIRASLQHCYEKGRYYDMQHEAIQTAAMGIRFIVDQHEKPVTTDEN